MANGMTPISLLDFRVFLLQTFSGAKFSHIKARQSSGHKKVQNLWLK